MKVLIVGLGSIGQRHMRNLRAVLGDGAEFLAFRVRGLTREIAQDFSLQAGANVEKTYGVRVFRDLEAALRERPDCAFVCNPSSLHLPAALAAARAGCHLFVEKPLSHSLEGVADLIAEVDRQGTVGYVGCQMRFHPCLRRVRDLLRNQAVGRVLAVRAQAGEYLPAWHPYEDYRGTYAARRDLGGGVILTQIHEMDYLYWFFGVPRRVVAVGGHLSGLDIDVEDVASILMEFAPEGRTLPVHLQADYIQRPGTRTCEIIGEDGRISMDLRAGTVTRNGGRGEEEETFSAAPCERNDMFLSEIRHFLACMRGEETPMVSLRDGMKVLRMALAARESLETGRVVSLA